MAHRVSPVDPFRDRVPSSNVDSRATFPRTLRLPSPDEAARGVAIAYAGANFCVYRAVVDRLRDGEGFRMETQFGDYEMSRWDLERTFPGIVASQSYREGPPSHPRSCYYVVGPPPANAATFLADRGRSDGAM